MIAKTGTLHDEREDVMKRVMLATGFVALALLSAVPEAQQPIAGSFVPVTDKMLASPDPGDWLMWRRTWNSWGYSPLTQINKTNVRQLTLAWSHAMTPGIQEGTPLVHSGILFMPNPADVIHALNAKTGDLLWEYKRAWPEDLKKYFPVPEINRNLAIHGNYIIDTSGDDFVFALDASTGRLAWETKILDYRMGAQQTSGPIIVNGKVISGRGCEPEGGPDACVITAHDATSGRELWRTHTIPQPGEPGYDTWGNVPYQERRHVGTWMVPSYDPDLNLIIVGTSVTSPAPKYMLGGSANKHLYHNSTLALNADTGKIVWYYQHLVDHWDLDHPFERLIVDTAVAPNPREVTWINPKIRSGERRKVVTGIPGKTGIVYTLDRQTGEFLWARPTVAQTVVRRIDGATGEVIVNEDSVFTADKEERFICPNTAGGKNWEAGAYSPLTNAMYFPLQNTCMQLTSTGDKTSLYAINAKPQIATTAGNMAGTVQAISVETGTIMWKYQQRAGTTSLVATASGLLFGGDVNGRFRALDQATGKVLWETNLGSAVTGYPITFAIDGKQYVAVSTGSSLATGGIAALTPELKPSNANNLFVFTLPN
jgi:PQQ-dependent dehydrogenase (methanol/ethanol family)